VPGGSTIALIIGSGGDDDTGSLYEVASNGGALRPFRIPGGPSDISGISWKPGGKPAPVTVRAALTLLGWNEL
jgi:hypothetical protein